MCLIIHAPAGKDIPREYLSDAWKQNSDGAGFAYTDAKGNLVVVKGLMTLKQLQKRLDKHPVKDVDFTLHFRWATHGMKDKNNTHPWTIGDKVAVIHNGIFGHVKYDKVISDTGVWTRDIILPLHKAGKLAKAIDTGWLRWDIGSGNKVVIHRKNHEPVILNEKGGTWHDGLWYSNEYWGGPFERWFRGWVWEEETKDYSSACYTGKLDSDDSTADNVTDAYEAEYANYEREAAMELLAEFLANENNLAISSTQELIEYLDDATHYYPGLKHEDVDKIREKAEWHLFFLVDERREAREKKEKAKKLAEDITKTMDAACKAAILKANPELADAEQGRS